MFVRAADEKTTEKPAAAAKEKPAKAAKAVRLTKPWNQVASLTDEQKTQIADLHKKANEERKQVDQREHDAIMAVLNDSQKKELEEMTAKEAADKKMKKAPAAGEETKKPEKPADAK